jgi:hypothetical protein
VSAQERRTQKRNAAAVIGNEAIFITVALKSRKNMRSFD